MSKQESCEQRLPQHLASRLAHIDALATLANVSDSDELLGACERESVRELLGEIAPDALAVVESYDPTRADCDDDALNALDFGEIADAAYDARTEVPLGVSAMTVFRVELSTGGPADWLEVFCSEEDTGAPAEFGRSYSIERIVYHFSDWFDHAEQTLSGDELQSAEMFVRSVVPELVD